MYKTSHFCSSEGSVSSGVYRLLPGLSEGFCTHRIAVLTQKLSALRQSLRDNHTQTDLNPRSSAHITEAAGAGGGQIPVGRSWGSRDVLTRSL